MSLINYTLYKRRLDPDPPVFTKRKKTRLDASVEEPPPRISIDNLANSEVSATVEKKKILTQEESSKPNLLELYGMDFDSLPKMRCNVRVFLQLRELVFLIESHVASKPSQKKLRAYVRDVIADSQMTLNKKMAELGAFLYLLESDLETQNEDEPSSFQEVCKKELVRVVEQLRSQYSLTLGRKRNEIPSGVPQYLLTTFARMILTEEQKLNIGAIYTIIDFLTSPNGKLSLYFKPEHRTQILRVLNQILMKKKFQSLLQEKINVHHTLNDLILLDLKLGKDETITSTHVMWSCLVALFFDVRQLDSCNCFSVCTYIYAIHASPYRFLLKMKEWLIEGYFSADGITKLPIFQLIERNLFFIKDLTTKLEAKNIQDLTTIEQITAALGCQQLPTLEGTDSLLQYLEKILKSNAKEQDLVHAENLYAAYKYNALATMLISCFTFHGLNIRHFRTSDSCITPVKKRFLADFLVPFEVSLPAEAVKKIEKKLTERIWLMDYTDRHVDIKNKTITYGFGQNKRTLTTNDTKVFFELLTTGCYFIYYDGQQFLHLERISDLQKVLIAIGQETCKDSELVSLIGDVEFASAIATSCAEVIDLPQVTWEFLLAQDLLILPQGGARTAPILKNLYNMHLEKVTFDTSSANEFLSSLNDFFESLDPLVVQEEPLLVFENKDHVFLLTTKKCSHLFKTKKEFNLFIKKYIKIAAYNYLNKNISNSQLVSLINHCIAKYPDLKREFKTIKGNQARSNVRSQLIRISKRPQMTKVLQKIFDEELNKIKINQPRLKKILTKLGVNIADSELANIYQLLCEKFPNSYAFPYDWARVIYKALIELERAIVDPYVIEHEICKEAGLPISLDIGDFLWGDTDRESPIHNRFVIRYHFGIGNFQYFRRSKKKEVLYAKKHFRRTKLFYKTKLALPEGTE